MYFNRLLHVIFFRAVRNVCAFQNALGGILGEKGVATGYCVTIFSGCCGLGMFEI